MKVYIAGRITGNPGYKEQFALAASRLKMARYTPLNPADASDGMSRATYMRLSFALIDESDFVMALPNWESSEGARLEKAYCDYTGKQWRTDYNEIGVAVS